MTDLSEHGSDGRLRGCWRCWTKAFALCVVCALTVTGCQWGKRDSTPLTIENQTMGRASIAVAPAVNLSGSADFDPNQLADLMASELSYAEGIEVVPVNRVLAILDVQRMPGVESPEHALELVGLLGVDALLVFAVTEYDPYDPPIIGITAQLYGARPGQGVGRLDPVALSRQGRTGPSTFAPAARGLLSQKQRVFDASHAALEAEIKAFARERGTGESPYGWRRFVVSQRDFFRFCCHATIKALLNGESKPVDEEARKAEG